MEEHVIIERANRVICCSLELIFSFSPSTVPQPHDHPGSEQRYDVQDEVRSIFLLDLFVRPLWPMMPWNHFSTCDPQPQAMMKLEVHVGAQGLTAGSHVDIPGQRYH